jgi:mRNA interferase YafQ
MREIQKTSEFKRNLKLAKKRGKDLNKLVAVVELLQVDAELPEALKDHALTGNFAGLRDCHIEPDWLLIYQKIDNPYPILKLEFTGTHSDIF